MADGDVLIIGNDHTATGQTTVSKNRFFDPVMGLFNSTGVGLHVTGGTNTESGRPIPGEGIFATSLDAAGVVGGGNPGISGFSDSIGVSGESRTGIGVLGTTNSTDRDKAAVYGRCSAGDAVKGDTDSGAAIVGIARAPRGLAGFFQGDVVITGEVIQIPQVEFDPNAVLHSTQSAERVVEDFGEARLVNGGATVKLRPSFTNLIAKGYHVFLTPRGDSNGLFVMRQNANSFAVREQKGGKSNLMFSYRIVGVARVRSRRDVAKISGRKILATAPPKPPQSSTLKKLSAKKTSVR